MTRDEKGDGDGGGVVWDEGFLLGPAAPRNAFQIDSFFKGGGGTVEEEEEVDS